MSHNCSANLVRNEAINACNILHSRIDTVCSTLNGQINSGDAALQKQINNILADLSTINQRITNLELQKLK